MSWSEVIALEGFTVSDSEGLGQCRRLALGLVLDNVSLLWIWVTEFAFTQT